MEFSNVSSQSLFKIWSNFISNNTPFQISIGWEATYLPLSWRQLKASFINIHTHKANQFILNHLDDNQGPIYGLLWKNHNYIHHLHYILPRSSFQMFCTMHPNINIFTFHSVISICKYFYIIMIWKCFHHVFKITTLPKSYLFSPLLMIYWCYNN